MASIGEVKRKLPQDFIEWIYNKYNSNVADKVIHGMSEKRYTTLRVNSLKADVQKIMDTLKQNNIKFDRVSWYKDALIIKNADEKDISKLDIFKNGEIYMQSLSSMIPPIVLEPKCGESVLDLTAAPGSKTTQIAAMMDNKGYILANECNKIRGEVLKHNISIQGVSIVEVSINRGETIGSKYKEKFDRVLVDAPCSGEGRFIYNSRNTYSAWSEKEINKLSGMQKKLLESGFNALKKNGVLVYSTCTLNECENDSIVDWAVKTLDLKLSNISIDIGEKNLLSNSKYMMKVIPSKQMEGFFICKFIKQ